MWEASRGGHGWPCALSEVTTAPAGCQGSRGSCRRICHTFIMVPVDCRVSDARLMVVAWRSGCLRPAAATAVLRRLPPLSQSPASSPSSGFRSLSFPDSTELFTSGHYLQATPNACGSGPEAWMSTEASAESIRSQVGRSSLETSGRRWPSHMQNRRRRSLPSKRPARLPLSSTHSGASVEP